MAWTTPRTWTVGEVVTAAQMNEQLRDNLNYLKSRTDVADYAYILRTFASTVTVSNTTNETTVWSYTVPGGLLGTNNALLMKMYLSTVTYQNGILRVKYGTATVAQFTIVSNVVISVDMMMKANNSTNQQITITTTSPMSGTSVSSKSNSNVDSSQPQSLLVTYQPGQTSDSGTFEFASISLYVPVG